MSRPWIIEELERKAYLDSPALAGNPTAPTPDKDAADDAVATAGFVRRALEGATVTVGSDGRLVVHDVSLSGDGVLSDRGLLGAPKELADGSDLDDVSAQGIYEVGPSCSNAPTGLRGVLAVLAPRDGSWARQEYLAVEGGRPFTWSRVALSGGGWSSWALDLNGAVSLDDTLSFGVDSPLSVSEMAGATSETDGSHGIVPAPMRTDSQKFLKGDGTWSFVPAGSVSGVLSVDRGGTGARTASFARVALDVPPTSHSSSDASYGLATESLYGHARAANEAEKPVASDTRASVGENVSVFARADHVHPLPPNVSGVVQVWHGGTGSSTVEGAHVLLDTPPKSHSSSSGEYGLASRLAYGHARAYTGTPMDAQAEASAGTVEAEYAMGDHVHAYPVTISGILPIERGGTGATSIYELREKLELPSTTEVLHSSGIESIDGEKTFTGGIRIPDPSSDASGTEAVNASWVIGNVYSKCVHLDGNETVHGSKSFDSVLRVAPPSADASGNEAVTASWVLGNVSNYVGLSGDESVSGVKTFIDGIRIGGSAGSSTGDSVATVSWTTGKITESVSCCVKTTGDESVSGRKSFSSVISAASPSSESDGDEVATTGWTRDFVGSSVTAVTFRRWS